jgi:hypothetical protein
MTDSEPSVPVNQSRLRAHDQPLLAFAPIFDRRRPIPDWYDETSPADDEPGDEC